MKTILKRHVKALVVFLVAYAGGVVSAAPRTLDVSTVDSRYFVDANGKTFIPVGCNICFPRMYDAASSGSRAACEEKFFGWLRAFAANGGNFVRLWLGHPFFEIMPERAGEYDPAAEATLKKTVALCEELGIKLKLTLESFRTVHPAGKEGKGMYSAFFNRPLYAPYAKNMREFLHSGKCARIYLGKAQRLKELGLGDSPAVACWELWNEINCIGSWRGDVGPWSDRMLEQLRVMFPRQMTVQNLGSFSGPSAYDYYDYLGRIPLNHFMQVHRYLDPGAELDVCRGPMDVLAADAVKELLDRRPDAPAVLAEVGAVKPNHTGPSELYAKDKLGMLLHDEIFAPFFAGSAGCGQPWHWDHQYVDGNNLWWHFARFAMAVKGIDPALEHFRPFHTETRRLRVWGLRGMNTTLLWCRDKANTWESELVRGEPPATITGEKVPFAKSFTCYLPWENRWVNAGKDGKLPDFKRSIVVRIMHATEWEKQGATPAPLTSCGRAGARPSLWESPYGEPPSRRLTGTTGVSPVDCSMAVPDELVTHISFRVDELRSVSNAHCKAYSIDFSNDAQYRAAGAQKFFERRQEDGKSFVRFGLKGKTAFAGGICPAKPFAVRPNTQYTLKFTGRCPQGRCLMYLRLFDEKGKNVSARVMAPKGWTYTKYNIAIYRLSDQSSATWHEEEATVQIPEGVHAVLPVLSTSFDGKAEWYDCRALTFTEKPLTALREKIAFQRREVAGDGSLVLTSDEASLRLKASLSKDDAGMVKVSVDVADTSVPPRPRALDVALEWKHDLTGWTWHKDWRNDSSVVKDSFLHNFKNITGIPVGIYPFTAVSRDGKGVAIGTALDDPAFEHGVVTQDGLTSRRALGLLKRGSVGTSAKLDWLVFSFPGTWGFRSAAKKYYASQAGKIPVVANGPAKEGMRSYLGVSATQLPENVDDFGLAYFIPGGSKAERARARELGMAVHPYILAWQMPTHHYKDYSVMPPMEDRIAELKSWLPITNEKGHRNFKSKSDLAKLVLGSMEWYDGVVHYWRLNVDPRLPAPSAASHFFDVIKGWGLDTIDGVYLDNVYVQNFNNVRPDHLAVMTEPLVYDPETAQPCAHAMQHQVAFVKALGDWLHPFGKSISGNVFAGGGYRFNATLIDVFGSETGCWGNGKNRDERLISGEAYPDEGMCEKRFFAYHRPVSDMLQDGNWTTPAPAITAEGIAGYVEHHLFYGFYPSIVTIGGEDFPGYRGWKRYFGPSRQCERDRALFKKATPLLRRLNKAGWQLETFARSRNPKVLVERYGELSDGGECLITVRNDSKDAVETELVFESELAGVAQLVPLWQGGAPLDGVKGVFKVRLGPWRTDVYLAKPAVRDVMEPLPPGAVTLTGGLEVPIEKSIAHWHKGNVPYREFAEFFRKGRPKFALGEMWGKFVRSGAMQYRHRRDSELKAVLDGAVADILATERPNGSISCVPEELQPGGDGHSRPHCSDLWERKYVMLALEDYYEWVERRPEVLASLQRQADCLIRQVGPAPKRDIREIGWSPNCIESSSLLEPFMRLYKLTGRKDYLDFARYIIESGGAKGSDLFAQARAGVMPWRMGEPYPKAYEMTSIFEGLAEWHRVTGDEPAREAVVKYFDSVLRHEITIVGNGGGNYPHWPRWSGEAWDNTAAEQSNPDMTRMMETCVGVTWMKYASQVLRLTGDVRAVDAIELYVYNGLLGAMKPDGDGFSYVNLLNGEKVTNKGWGWTFASGPVTCCNLNGPMGLAYIPFVAVMQAQDGPVVNLYNAGTAVAKTASGGDVRLVAEGDLLNRDGWRMTVSPSLAESFTISLRIPAWSEKTTVTVNGKSVGPVAPGKYLKIARKWLAGDKVAVAFDFKARKLDAPVGRNHASAPFQAVTWGPIALARDENTDPNYAAPVAIQAAADGTVAVERITPASPAHKLEFRVPTKDGFITMCDYASVDGWKGKHVQTWLPKAPGK